MPNIFQTVITPNKSMRKSKPLLAHYKSTSLSPILLELRSLFINFNSLNLNKDNNTIHATSGHPLKMDVRLSKLD
ncbi:protein of unknown function [Ruminococcaceae bacterium BL-4]|nr:protein of unknown function [Ruminococcaceae bacterium BL-4]